MKLNIFVLHNVPRFATTLRNMADYALCFQRYAPQHNYLYHNMADPIPDALRDIRFHAVIIDSTALALRTDRPRERWQALKERWSFIGESDAVKLVFPQDDYHHSEMLDDLCDDWNVDAIYSVMPMHHQMLYPRSIKKIDIEVVLTGYVDDKSVSLIERFGKPFDQRSIDLGQRVTMYSPRGGRHAQIKGKLALAAKEHALRAGYTVDVSTSDAHRITGDNWFRFLGNVRFVTGSESGVSLWDPDGNLFDRVVDYRERHPLATFEEVEAACFPGQDNQYVFSAVSPRLFEAAMMRCCQMMAEAPYLGVLKPHEHYIPVKPDISNIRDAVDAMRDTEGALRRIDACYATLIETPDFRYSTLVDRIMRRIDKVVADRHITGTNDLTFKFLSQKCRFEGSALRYRAKATAIATAIDSRASKGDALPTMLVKAALRRLARSLEPGCARARSAIPRARSLVFGLRSRARSRILGLRIGLSRAAHHAFMTAVAVLLPCVPKSWRQPLKRWLLP